MALGANRFLHQLFHFGAVEIALRLIEPLFCLKEDAAPLHIFRPAAPFVRMDKAHLSPFLFRAMQEHFFGFFGQLFPWRAHVKAIKARQIIVDVAVAHRFVRAGDETTVFGN